MRPMEVIVQSKDFHFYSTPSSPYVSAPSSPKLSGDPFNYYYHYTSAPTSPTRVAAVLAASSVVPFDWEDQPGTPKFNDGGGGGGGDGDGIDDFDFAFEFSKQRKGGEQLPDLTTADVLFEEGKIKPLKPPPRLYNHSFDDRTSVPSSSPRSPKSPNSRRSIWSSPRHKGKDFDPFTAALLETTRERGRQRDQPSSDSSSRSRKGSRSLSPLKGGGVGEFFQKSFNPSKASKPAASTTTIASECTKSGSGRSKKWRLRDLLLFRSASEGRATGNRSKDPLRKYTVISPSNSSASLFPLAFGNKRGGEDSTSSSFRSNDSSGSIRRSTDNNGSMRRGSVVSAHEKHYVSNRAASEEMKKKTPLPYKSQGIFSFLRLNPTVNNNIAKGFPSG